MHGCINVYIYTHTLFKFLLVCMHTCMLFKVIYVYMYIPHTHTS